MSSIAFEIAVVVVLILANGVFAMAEISLVSARRARLRHLAEAGDTSAAAALELAESPNRFLATVQIGITLVGIVAGAFGGASIAPNLAEPLAKLPWLSPSWADKIAFALVVIPITYLSLIVGELIPKRLGMANAEGYARLLAKPMRFLSRIASPAVAFLGASTDGLMKLLGLKMQAEAAVSDEEVKAMMREGLRAGTFVPMESTMVENILDLDDLTAQELMTPKAKIIWIQESEPHDLIWHKIVVSGHSNFPVYGETRDHVVGMLSVKSIYANLAAGVPATVKDLMTPPLLVPATTPASQMLDIFKSSGKHVALLVDEFGHVVGLVTIHDLLEAIVGDMPSMEDRLKPSALKREDGSWLIDASLHCDDFEEHVTDYKLPLPDDREYQTIAGYVMQRLGHVPAEGEFFEEQGYRVEIIDMDGHRVDKILMIPLKNIALKNLGDGG